MAGKSKDRTKIYSADWGGIRPNAGKQKSKWIKKLVTMHFENETEFEQVLNISPRERALRCIDER